MRTLVIGNGAREHALAYSLSLDPSVTEVHVAPGNPGIGGVATLHPGIRGEDAAAVVALARELTPDLVVIGPEIPLVAGVADALRAEGFAVFGPSGSAARIEGSKAFAKGIMASAGVKTAHAEAVGPGASDEEIGAAIDRFGPTWVVKDDGLAGGKGVVVTPDRAAAVQHVHDVHAAGNPVLLESFLDGPEVSLFCLVDGETVVPLLPAQDHKRVRDNDEGPNTGVPVAKQMVKEGCPFSGLLYAGLAWGSQGPAVVEFNCRFGDPETQAVLDLLKTPIGGVLAAVANGTLAELPPLEWEDGYAVTVVLAAGGYPEKPLTGVAISGAAAGDEARGVRAAGVAEDRAREGGLVSAGGRVLNVIGRGATLEEARANAYAELETIDLPGGHYRSDIGLAAVEGRIAIPE